MKFTVPRLVSVLSVSLVLLCMGCSNPADDAPDAKVGDAVAAETSESTDGVTFAIDPTSTIGFIGSKVTGSHEGGFNSFDGTIVLNDSDPISSSVNLSIDTTSLWSDNERLTGHLKSADFFDVENFPTAEFTSTSIAANDAGGYDITGNLTLHGVTKSIQFPATIEVHDGHVAAQAEFSINRFDFGIVYPGKTDDLIREEVLIKFNLSASPAV